MNPKRIVITGGPGTGKSSVISQLQSEGYACFEEISREIILQARKDGVEQLFLEKPILFSELLLKGRVEQYQEHPDSTTSCMFFDRGVHDVLAYLNYAEETYPDVFHQVCKTHLYDMVFILPPWEAIYKADNERYENFEQAKAIHQNIFSTYTHYNYSPVEVPKGTVEERVAFILTHIEPSV